MFPLLIWVDLALLLRVVLSFRKFRCQVTHQLLKLPPPIIIKSRNENTNINIDRNYLLNRANTALNKINVKTAKVNEQGTLIVQLPNETDHNIAIDNLKKVLPNSFNVERGKKLLPKLTVVGVPAEINENNIIKIICEKDDTINRLINEGEILDILGT